MKKLIVVLVIGVFLAGCSNLTRTQNSALVGSAAGAGIGQLIGGDTESTLIGAGVGGLAGGLAGAHSENQDLKRQQAYQQGYRSGYNQGQVAPPPQMSYNQSAPPPVDSRW